MEIIIGILKESYYLLNKMSVYLLFGFFVAGILHIFIKPGMIAAHLGKNNLASVIKAALFGIPLPLCSCGVLPAALSLRKEGASRGAVLSFLISTPTTGIDSIFATYALLGGLFTAYRVIASFIAGTLAGITSNLFFRHEKSREIKAQENDTCKVCKDSSCKPEHHSFGERIKGVFSYGFGTILKDVGSWIIIGIFVGGVISYFMPPEFIEKYIGTGWQSMFIMLVAGIPMYVCASGSLPITLALLLKGLNPGAAFVFLLTGPATNSVALTVISKELGKATAAIFLFSIIVSSLGLGYLLNIIYKYLNINLARELMHHTKVFPAWLEYSASSLLVLLIILSLFRKKK